MNTMITALMSAVLCAPPDVSARETSPEAGELTAPGSPELPESGEPTRPVPDSTDSDGAGLSTSVSTATPRGADEPSDIPQDPQGTGIEPEKPRERREW